MSIHVSVILERKGSEVFSVRPDATLATAVDKLAEHNIGALVVSSDSRQVDGILSERDVARCLSGMGPACLDQSVGELMTRVVSTCTPDDTIDDLMAVMTDKRIRHVPVLVDGELAGLVSVGDVVKARLDELEVQAKSLEQYVTGSST